MKSLVLTTLFTGAVLLFTTGCSHKSVRAGETASSTQMVSPTATQQLNLELAHFAFNSAELTELGKSVLRRNAEPLRSNPNLTIQAQGYCDDRGTVKYNLALGDRRAISVRNYLKTLGISGDRITTVSFGKSNPLDTRDNEQAWALNRRVSLEVQPKQETLSLR